MNVLIIEDEVRLAEALEKLMSLGIRLAVVTLGPHGALWRCGNSS